MSTKKTFWLLLQVLFFSQALCQTGKVIVGTGGNGSNIYNTSGELTSDREIILNGKRLLIKTDSVASDQTGLELRPGLYNEFANHWPLIIGAGPRGYPADSIAFGSYDSNLAIYTNTNGLRYGTINTFTSPRHIVDKEYVDNLVSGSTGSGTGGIYGGSGTLPGNIRVSGGPSQRSLLLDSISFLDIRDWNTGQALRVWQHIDSGAGKAFGRLLTLAAPDDSLDISYTDGLTFDITATKPIQFYSSEMKYFGSSFNLDFGAAGQISDLRATKTGIQYAADYSANYTARSLVDKEYVDNATGSGPTLQLLELNVATSNPSISTAFTKITVLNEAAKEGTELSWNATTDQVTYTGSAGRVRAEFALSWGSSNTFNQLAFVIRKNGVETRCKNRTISTGSGEDTAACGVCTFDVATNDTLEFGAYFDSGTANVQIYDANIVIQRIK